MGGLGKLLLVLDEKTDSERLRDVIRDSRW